jgi:hypothetical protein
MDGPDLASFDALTAKVNELGQMCVRLSRENAELRGEMSRLACGPVPAGPVAAPEVQPRAAQRRPAARRPRSAPGEDGGQAPAISRRRIGRALGAVAASAVGAGALIEMAQPAGAVDGSNVVAGNNTTAEQRTAVTYDGSSPFSGVVLLGNDSTYSGTGANFPAGAGGFAGAGSTAGPGGVANGVYGYTDNGGGNGVVGYNSNFASGAGAGVLGKAFSSGGAGVRGTNSQGTAVEGSSDSTQASATAIIGTITSTSPGGFSAAVRAVNNGTGGSGIGGWGLRPGPAGASTRPAPAGSAWSPAVAPGPG